MKKGKESDLKWKQNLVQNILRPFKVMIFFGQNYDQLEHIFSQKLGILTDFTYTKTWAQEVNRAWKMDSILQNFLVKASYDIPPPEGSTYLCCTTPCFHVISISLISNGDHPCAHYFLWILPLCALLLCSMTHYDITMAHDVARDAPLWHNNG